MPSPSSFPLSGLLSNHPKRPPGPSLRQWPASMSKLFADPLRALEEAHGLYGAMGYMRLATVPVYFISDPALLEQCLLTRSAEFGKGEGLTQQLVELLGQGLLSSHGNHWRRQRKLAAPALKRSHIAQYGQSMVAFAEQQREAWRNGELVALDDAMMKLTLRVVLKTLFGIETDEHTKAIGDALDAVMRYFRQRTQSWWRVLPRQVPTRRRREYDQAIETLDRVVYTMIRARRAEDEPGDDLLGRFLAARDDDGAQMSDEQLRDELVTMIIAGHETTALTLTFALRALALHPKVLGRLHDEVDEVCAGRLPEAADIPRMPWTKAVVQETLRLYPPAWAIGRASLETLELGGWSIPKDNLIIAPVWALHRDARWFSEPKSFLPERWLGGELERNLPRCVYMPFGAGPRVCIGNHFSMMEAMLIIATLSQTTTFHTKFTGELELEPSITLRPKHRVMMRVRQRQAT